MIVVALTLDYPPRRFIGSEMATHAMLRALRDAGHQVEVFTTKSGVPYEHDGIPVTPGARECRKAATAADVVVTHAELVKRLDGITTPVVAVTHNGRAGVASAVERKPIALLVHNCEATADELAAYRQAPYIVVHPPVDWRDYHTDRPVASAITLVNVTGEKGSDTFYELAERLPDHEFLGVLGGWGDPDIRDLPNVELIAQTDDMRSVYARTRILLMASEHESWGRVAVEAMASGIPVLATDLPGPREAVGAGGFLVELDWWDEYERLIRLLDDPNVYSEVSARASARARELDPAPELARFVASVEAVAAGRRGPWREDELVRYRHRRTKREALVRADSTKALRFARLADTWEVVA